MNDLVKSGSAKTGADVAANLSVVKVAVASSV
jgi:hypothetical protein